MQKNRENSPVDSDPFYSKENMERLMESIAEMEKTGGTIHDITPEILAYAEK